MSWSQPCRKGPSAANRFRYVIVCALTTMFCLRLVKFSKNGTGGISLEFVLSNRVPRSATILAYDFELWLLSDINRRVVTFLGKLWPDLLTEYADCSKLDGLGEKPFTLVWHYQPKDLRRRHPFSHGKKSRAVQDFSPAILFASLYLNPIGPLCCLR